MDERSEPAGAAPTTPRRIPSRRRQKWPLPVGVIAASLLLGAIVGGMGVRALGDDGPGSTQVAVDGGAIVDQFDDVEGGLETTAAASVATTEDEAATTVLDDTAATEAVAVPGDHDWGSVASALADQVQLPSDCGLPLDNAESLPNASRDYRGGMHEGIDFICAERGRDAVAAMDGRIVIANNSFEDPTPENRAAVLAVARDLGYTPQWTLAMMFGRFVVIDHGLIEGAGHVVTIYAHFEELDSDLRPGQVVAAGTRLGEIGNRGTETGATGGTRPQSIHLHWELHVDDEFLGEGQTATETRTTYATLFGR